jgi:predicted outer membrane lipoprotein
MSDWIHNLLVPWMALVVFGFTYLLAAAAFAIVSALANEQRAKSFKAISPGMLPVLGIIFGLFVAFTAAQVWADNDRAG